MPYPPFGGYVLRSIHCGSRGLGHQIGTEFLKQKMAVGAARHHIVLPDRGLACALANRQILTHLVR